MKPFPSILRSGSTYATKINETCGNRCARVWAVELERVLPLEDRRGWYYDCNITVGRVTNATLDKPDVSDSFAWMAAGAVALKGSYSTKFQYIEHRTYPYPHPCSKIQNGSADGMGRQMASFAIGTIAGAAMNNRPTRVLDQVYAEGERLLVPYFRTIHVMLGLTGGLLLSLSIIAAFVANRVVVVEDGPLAISHLLAPLVNRVGLKGSLLGGKDIGKEIQANVVFVCSDVDTSDNTRLYRLDVVEAQPRKRFPDGWYE